MIFPKKVWTKKGMVFYQKKPVRKLDDKVGIYDPNFTEVDSGEVYPAKGWEDVSPSEPLIIYDGEDPINIGTFEDGIKAVYQFVDWNGSVLKTGTVNDGETPIPPANPTREPTAQYTYTFSGWSPSVGPINKDTTYTAQYTATVNEYTIIFRGYDSSILQQSQVAYGTTPVYTGATPTHPEDVQYTYSFVGWSPTLHPVDGNQEYNPVFLPVAKTYVVNFTNDGNGTTSASSVGRDYGSSITISGNTITIADVTVTAIPDQGYEFDSWVNADGGDIPATLTTNLHIGATFRLAGYTITFQVSEESYSEGGGTISEQSIVVPVGTTVESNDPMHERHGSSLIFKNNGQTIATVNAIPNSGYMFEYWYTGSYYDEGYLLCEDLEFIGSFRSTITVTFVVNPVGGGTVSEQSIVVPEGSSASIVNDENHLIIDSNCYIYNEVIATASQGYNFLSWEASGTIIDSSNPINLGDQDITITVNFGHPYTITFQPFMTDYDSGDYIGNGGGTCSPSSVTVSAGAYASHLYGADTITITDPMYGITNVTFTKQQDTDQYAYFDDYGWCNYNDGSDLDLTYDYLIARSGISDDGTVGFEVKRGIQSYEVEVYGASSSGSGSESYSQVWNYKNYGTTWTINGSTINFSDGSYVTAVPDSGSCFGGWYIDWYSPSDNTPLSTTGTVTGQMYIYALYVETHTITFQPFMSEDSYSNMGDGGGVCNPVSVVVSSYARGTSDYHSKTFTIEDPILGNTTVNYTKNQDTPQYTFGDGDWTDYVDTQGNSDNTCSALEGDYGISQDGTVGYMQFTYPVEYEFSVDSHSPDGTVTCSDSSYDGRVLYGTTWSVSGNVITLSTGVTFTATPETGASFDGFTYDGSTLPASGTVTSGYYYIEAEFSSNSNV